VEECPSKLVFPHLYRICLDQENTVEVAANREWNLSYRRNFRERENEEWRNMLVRLQEINLTEGDQVT